jgi:hypothetical protein
MVGVELLVVLAIWLSLVRVRLVPLVVVAERILLVPLRLVGMPLGLAPVVVSVQLVVVD